MTTLSYFQVQFTKYRWEFLRRKSEYVNEWNELQEILESKYSDYMPGNGKMPIEEMQFCEKWKIAKTLNPDVSYDDYTKLSYIPEKYDERFFLSDAPQGGVLSNYGFDVHRLMFEWLNPGFLLNPAFEVLDGWEFEFDGDGNPYSVISDSFSKTGRLTFRVDLNYSKRRLAKEFKLLLDDWKAMYEEAYKKMLFRKFCTERDIKSYPVDDSLYKEFEKIYNQDSKQRKKKYGKKYHFDNFDLYLQVYDLKMNDKSWSEIKTALKLNSIQTARNHYKSACGIIDKGIEFYVK